MPRERDSEGGLGFLRGGARPPTQVLIGFIDRHKAVFGVEPVCTVLKEHGIKIAPSTYYEARSRPPSKRALRDAESIALIAAAREEKALRRRVGARKMWLYLRSRSHDVARCPVERLMAQ